MSDKSSVSELLQKAEGLETDIVSGKGEVNWQNRLELQRILEKAILLNVDVAVSRHVEQTLWNCCYKNCIDICMKLSSRKGAPDTIMFNMFLSAAVGFLTQFLCSLIQTYDYSCSLFKGDSKLGILQSSTDGTKQKASAGNLTYLVQFCLIHIGDILRHQKRAVEAESYYLNAVTIDGDFGHSFNQLGILETMRGSGLSSLYYYTRALYVRMPFALASSNIEKFYSLIDLSSPTVVVNQENFVNVFFQLFAAIHFHNEPLLKEEMCVAVGDQITKAIRNRKFTADSCIQMLVVTMGTLWKLFGDSGDDDRIQDQDPQRHSNPEMIARTFNGHNGCLVRSTALFFLQQLAVAMLRSALSGHMEVVSSALSILVCWMQRYHHLVATIDFFSPSTSSFVQHLCAVLNHVQTKFEMNAKKYERFRNIPLPEDVNFKGFLPLKSFHDSLDFTTGDSVRDQHTVRFCRICRMINYGRFLARKIDNDRIMKAHDLGDTDGKHLINVQFSCPSSTSLLDKEESAGFESTVGAQERPKLDRISSAPDKANSTKSSDSTKYPSVKRQTKVLPLITILEREKNGVGGSGDGIPKAADVYCDGSRVKAPLNGPKGDHFQHPPSFSSRSSGGSAGTQDNKSRYELPPRFQAAKLKQALSSAQNAYEKHDSCHEKAPQPPVFNLSSFPPLTTSSKPPIGSWNSEAKADMNIKVASTYEVPPPPIAKTSSSSGGVVNYTNVPLLNSSPSQLSLFQQTNSMPFSYSVPALGSLNRQRPVYPVPPPFLPPFASSKTPAAVFPPSSQPSVLPSSSRNSSISNLTLNTSTGANDIWSPNSLFIANTEDPYFKLWQPNAASLTVTNDGKTDENWLKDPHHLQPPQVMIKAISSEGGGPCDRDPKLPSFSGMPMATPTVAEQYMPTNLQPLLSQENDYSKLPMLMSEMGVQQQQQQQQQQHPLPALSQLFELGQGPFSYSTSTGTATTIRAPDNGHQPPPPVLQSNVASNPGHFSLFGNSLNPWEYPKWSKDGGGSGSH